MIGDSVCTDFHVSGAWQTFRRALSCHGSNWFVDDDPAPGTVRSLSKLLRELTPLVTTHYAGPGAMVVREDERENFFRRIVGTRNFSGQVTRLLSSAQFPELILISIGHNNVDWSWRCPPHELAEPEGRLPRQAREFRDNYAPQLQRLIDAGAKRSARAAIVVFGLVNFALYFEARAIAEQKRNDAPSLYPHLETTYKYYRSFRPELRHNLVRLSQMVNAQLEAMVNELRDLPSNVQVRYSDALATADLRRVELLHAVDCWHPSIEGHNVLAEAAFRDLGPSLEFLGITPANTQR